MKQYWRYLTNLLSHPLVKRRRLTTLLTILWWKCNQWWIHLPAIIQLTPEAKIICPPDSAYGSYIVYAHFPEYAEMQFVYQYLDVADVFIDIGSYPGDFALLAASKITRGRVLAVEPNPDSQRLIKANIDLNNWQRRIKLIPQAVGDAEGERTLVTTGPAETNRLASNNHLAVSNRQTSAHDASTTVFSITIDALLRTHKLKTVDLVKIDVEGAERLVFAGADRALRSHALKVIIFEVNPGMKRYGTTVNSTVEALRQNHYQLYAFNSEGKLHPLPRRLPAVKTTTNWVAIAPNMVDDPRLRPFTA